MTPEDIPILDPKEPYRGEERRRNYIDFDAAINEVRLFKTELDKLPSKEDFESRASDLEKLFKNILKAFVALAAFMVIFGITLYIKIQGGHSKLEIGQRVTNCVLRTPPAERSDDTELNCRALYEG